jgi:hypothetical protein
LRRELALALLSAQGAPKLAAEIATFAPAASAQVSKGQ